MKALTLTQPWATLVAIGAKRIETRSWRTSYRGPLAIHAAKSFPVDCRALCAVQPFVRALATADYHSRVAQLLGECGKVLAVVDLKGCWSTFPSELNQAAWLTTFGDGADEEAFGDYGPERWGWRMERLQRLATPVPCKGFQQLWTLPVDIEREVMSQIKGW